MNFNHSSHFAKYYWAFHTLPQICTAFASAHVSCSLKQMRYKFAVIQGPLCMVLEVGGEIKKRGKAEMVKRFKTFSFGYKSRKSSRGDLNAQIYVISFYQERCIFPIWPGSSYPFSIVNYRKWVTTSWTYSSILILHNV